MEFLQIPEKEFHICLVFTEEGKTTSVLKKDEMARQEMKKEELLMAKVRNLIITA